MLKKKRLVTTTNAVTKKEISFERMCIIVKIVGFGRYYQKES